MEPVCNSYFEYLFVIEIGEGKPEREFADLEEIVAKSNLFEYMFWDMANIKEMWLTDE